MTTIGLITTVAFLGLSGFNWLLLGLSTIIALGVVERLRCSNLVMIPVTLVVWLLFWVAIGVLKLAWALLPLIVLGVIVWVIAAKARKA